MNIKINQRGGFGDIFFTIKIGQRLVEMGHNVYWPVVPEYAAYIAEYVISDIKWVEAPNDATLLDIGRASWLVNWENKDDIYDKVMESKYIYADRLFPGIGSYDDWCQYLKINRNFEKEAELKDKILKDINEPFALVNRHFATEHIKLDMPIRSDLREVEINKVPGFTLFDWCGIIELAEEIRIPDSSFPYIVEILNTTDKIYMYKRNEEPYVRTKPIWKKKWRFME